MFDYGWLGAWPCLTPGCLGKWLCLILGSEHACLHNGWGVGWLGEWASLTPRLAGWLAGSMELGSGGRTSWLEKALQLVPGEGQGFALTCGPSSCFLWYLALCTVP